MIELQPRHSTEKQKSPAQWGDIAFRQLTLINAAIVLLLLTAVMVSLFMGSLPTWKSQGLSFLWGNVWNSSGGVFGALGPVMGTLATSAIAIILALPLSIGIAFFLTELSPQWIRQPLGIAIELLAAIPSIIYGMWGLFVIAPLFIRYVQPLLAATLGKLPIIGTLFSGASLGVGVLTAGIVLAIMIVPFITAILRDVFSLVPVMLKESAYGLGATTWEVVRHIVIPYTKTGMVGAVMLGLGRALGETMAVTFVIGNAHGVFTSLFSPGNSIASTLANEFNEASSDMHRSALLALAMVLFLITTIVLACARYLIARTEQYDKQ